MSKSPIFFVYKFHKRRFPVENKKMKEQKMIVSEDGLVRLRDRINFARAPRVAEYPDLLGVQLAAYRDFLQEDVPPSLRENKGLQQAFLNNFPIEDASSIFQLEFIEYFIEKPKYSEEECRERELTFAKPLKAKLRLSSKAEIESED
jgi:DNA-directed RNA polymerase subunit beta